jgi:hypothetical protein
VIARATHHLGLAAALAVASLGACKSRQPAPEPQRAQPAASAAAGLALALAAASIIPAPTQPAEIKASPPAPRTLHVTRVPKPLAPSSHFDVATWGSSVNTHTLLDSAGRGAVPVSDARLLWGDGQLYVAFYAGDLDLQIHDKKPDGPVWKDDSVTFSFFRDDGQKRVISASPTGVLADGTCPLDAADLGDARCNLKWNSHSRIAADYDGTINQLGDRDEEWNIQFAIPLKSVTSARLPGDRIRFSILRCEVAYDGVRACGAWGTASQPAELVLD